MEADDADARSNTPQLLDVVECALNEAQARGDDALLTNPVDDAALTARIMNDAVLRALFPAHLGGRERAVARFLERAEAGRFDIALRMIQQLDKDVFVAPSRIPAAGMGWGLFARRQLDSGHVLGFYGGAIVGNDAHERAHGSDSVDAASMIARRVRPGDPVPRCSDYGWALPMARPAMLHSMDPAVQSLRAADSSGKSRAFMYILAGHVPNQLAFSNTVPPSWNLGAHKVRNNVIAETIVWRGAPRSVYVLTRDVRAGEELFVGYGESRAVLPLPALSSAAHRTIEAMAAARAHPFDWPEANVRAAAAQLPDRAAELRAGADDAQKRADALASARAEESPSSPLKRRAVKAPRKLPSPSTQRALEEEEAVYMAEISEILDEASEEVALLAMVAEGADAAGAAASADEHAETKILQAHVAQARAQVEALKRVNAERPVVHGYRNVRDAQGRLEGTEVLVSYGDAEREWHPIGDLYALQPARTTEADVRPYQIIDFRRDAPTSRQAPPDMQFLVEWTDRSAQWLPLADLVDAGRDYAHGDLLVEYLDYLENKADPDQAPTYDEVADAVEKRVEYLRSRARGV